MKDLLPIEIETAYKMCGVIPTNPEVTTLIFNGLRKKGINFSLSDAVSIRIEIEKRILSLPHIVKWNQVTRNYYKYNRNKR